MAGRNEEIRQLIATKGKPGERTFTESEKVFIYDAMCGLINKIAAVWVKFGRAEYEDLLQEGYIGLSEAMQRYDPDSVASFSSYAANWINAKMSYYSKKCSGLPFGKYKLLRQYRETVARLQADKGRTPTETELAEAMGVSDATLSDIITAEKQLQLESLDAMLPGTDFSYLDTLQSSQDTAQDIIETEERNRVLYTMIDELPPRQREAIKRKYLEEKSTQETAESLGISCDSARGCIMCGLDNMRRKKHRLTPYYDVWRIKSIAYKKSGLKSWREKWESSVEYAAIKELQERWERVKDLSFTG